MFELDLFPLLCRRRSSDLGVSSPTMTQIGMRKVLALMILATPAFAAEGERRYSPSRAIAPINFSVTTARHYVCGNRLRALGWQRHRRETSRDFSRVRRYQRNRPKLQLQGVAPRVMIRTEIHGRSCPQVCHWRLKAAVRRRRSRAAASP